MKKFQVIETITTVKKEVWEGYEGNSEEELREKLEDPYFHPGHKERSFETKRVSTIEIKEVKRWSR